MEAQDSIRTIFETCENVLPTFQTVDKEYKSSPSDNFTRLVRVTINSGWKDIPPCYWLNYPQHISGLTAEAFALYTPGFMVGILDAAPFSKRNSPFFEEFLHAYVPSEMSEAHWNRLYRRRNGAPPEIQKWIDDGKDLNEYFIEQASKRFGLLSEPVKEAVRSFYLWVFETQGDYYDALAARALELWGFPSN